ncbi:NUDIX hydrolase [uncultured Pelagimonas sp.]|uniref:NUDIX hydrolase n=1 Tax=uncultured Pelagimonas sp. TaxID=1618102 RepID=UPI00260C19B9|nr:NUDIX hydrolase [uncultured Pelagimonas sp.]
MAKKGEQIAALPLRWDEDGKLEVLMVTSRGTGRWIVPKGWEMDNTKPWKAASIEALEEAGIKGRISRDVIGTYKYNKVLDNGKPLPCVVRVYPMIVEKLKRDWKERKQRTRRWFTPKAAARRVQEKQLAKMLRSLDRKPRKQPVIRELLKAS